jgi:hypothetical protein
VRLEASGVTRLERHEDEQNHHGADPSQGGSRPPQPPQVRLLLLLEDLQVGLGDGRTGLDKRRFGLVQNGHGPDLAFDIGAAVLGLGLVVDERGADAGRHGDGQQRDARTAEHRLQGRLDQAPDPRLDDVGLGQDRDLIEPHRLVALGQLDDDLGGRLFEDGRDIRREPGGQLLADVAEPGDAHQGPLVVLGLDDRQAERFGEGGGGLGDGFLNRRQVGRALAQGRLDGGEHAGVHLPGVAGGGGEFLERLGFDDLVGQRQQILSHRNRLPRVRAVHAGHPQQGRQFLHVGGDLAVDVLEVHARQDRVDLPLALAEREGRPRHLDDQ